jgi:hypothetical protein
MTNHEKNFQGKDRLATCWTKQVNLYLKLIIMTGMVMSAEKHYKIEYLMNGVYKKFYVCTSVMDNAEAWHWATVDAGVGEIPRYRRDPVVKLCKPKAERLGITDVKWGAA